MNLRPKTKRRLAVLISIALISIALGTAVVGIQFHRHALIRQGYRDAAMAALDRGDYLTAMLGFKKYLSQNSSDAPAIYAYAIARSQVPEPDLQHLVKAKAILARYLELNPTDSVAQHKLLEIYKTIRYDAEAQSLADKLLTQDPRDVSALKAKLQATVDQSDFANALPISMKVNELAPLDLEAQLTTYRLMAQLKRPTAEIVARAEEMLTQHPTDPRFELLRAIAADFDGDETSVRKWLALAASQPAPDVQFIRELSSLFERLGMFEQARTLLAKSLDGAGNDPEVLATLVERQWEAGETEAALGRLISLNETDLRTNAHLLGLKALMLYTLGEPRDRAEADVILQNLSKRDGENVASAWNTLLRSHFARPKIDPKQAVVLCRSALHRDPQNPLAHYFLGVAYDELGETELAVQSWRWAAKLAPPWATPHIKQARTLLDSSRIDEAYQEALAAHAGSGDFAESSRILALTGYAKLPAVPSKTELSSLLELVRDIRKDFPSDPATLPVYVGLLAQSGQTAKAVQAANDALEQALPPQILLQLAQISSSQHLGMEPQIADLLEQINPPTPKTVYDRALVLAMLGERMEGAQSLTAVELRQNADRTTWQLLTAQYRQSINDGDLVPTWTALADNNPDNLAVQRAVLQASAPWSDLNLINRTIDRLKSLTGDECLTWRLARAQLDLAEQDDTKSNAGAAAAMMADVVRLAPDLADAQFLWAKALEGLDDPDGAIERLRIAAMLAPANLVINEYLADRLQLRGRDDEARVVLETLAQNSTVHPTSQLELARILWQEGQIDAAIRVLNSPTARAAEPDRSILLAQIDQNQGKIDQAAQIYSSLTTSPTPPDSVVIAAAWFTAWRGDVTAGLHMLDGQTENRELTLGRFDEAFASPDAAMVHYQAALTTAPSDASTWLSLAGFQLRRGRFDDAIATADSGLKVVTDARELSAMKLRAKSLSPIPPSPALQLLIVALSNHATDPAAVETLDAVADPLANHELPEQFLPRLQIVADNNLRFIPAQMLLAEQNAAAGHLKKAEEATERAMHAALIDPEPAREMATLCASTQQWEQALTAANQWRKRILNRPEPADLEIAEAATHLHDPTSAIKQLEPYLDQIKQSPNQNMDAVQIYTRALAGNGQRIEAQQLLEPLLPQSPRWRLIWLNLAVQTSTNAGQAKEWIDKVSALARAGSEDERLALGRAFYQIGIRLNDPALLASAHEIAQRLSDGGNPTAPTMVLVGDLALQTRDFASAEAAFRRAMKTDPNAATPLNQLASSILLQDGSLSEARQWAEQAVALNLRDGQCRHTLASINAKAGNLPEAATGFESAIELNATDVQSMIALANVQLRLHQSEKAISTLNQAEPLLQDVSLRQQAQSLRQQALRKTTLSSSITDLK